MQKKMARTVSSAQADWFLVVIPRFPRLKEWAYAGVFFDLTGAVSSQLASGLIDAGTMAYPIVMTGVAVASWALRPPSRRLDPG